MQSGRKRQFQHRPLVLQAVGTPEIPRGCKKAERRSKCRVKGAGRTACVFHPFAQDQLLLFELSDAILAGPDHARHQGIEDAFEQLGDLLFDLGGLRGKRLGLFLRLGEAAGLEVLEHGAGDLEQARCGLDGMQQLLELALDHVAAVDLP